MTEASATAEGELSRTPLAHLLVYALDRRLTGALFLAPPEGDEHVVRLVRGVPVKVRPGDGFSPLGQMLVEAGAIDLKTLEAALATKGLLGDMLLLAGRVERDTLEKIAETQFRKRMVRLFGLPPETTYRYYDGHEELAEYGGDPASVDPLSLLWAGIRIHGDLSTMMETTLARLGEAPLRLSPLATVARFALDPEEAQLLERLGQEVPVAPPIPDPAEAPPAADPAEAPAPGPAEPAAPATRPITLPELCAASFPGLARRFVYALAITRQIEMGTGLLPLGAEPVPSSSQRNLPTATAAPGTAVGRMALKSTVHRIGAAAPDAPGDGERGPSGASSRRPRERTPDEPSSSRSSALPPVSSVESVPAPESGVVAVTPEIPAPAAEPATAAPPPAVDRGTAVESDTMRSALDSIHDLRASVPDLEQEPSVAPAVAPSPAPVETPAGEGLAVDGSGEHASPNPSSRGASGGVPPTVDESSGSGEAAGVEAFGGGDAGEEDAPQIEQVTVVEEEAAADPLAGMSAEELFWVASECLAERDMTGAVEACVAGLKAAPEDPDLLALEAWARAQSGGADIKALAVQLDEVLGAHEAHVEARYYRGMLRKRLGDEEGSLRDLRQVIALSPTHEGAGLALAALEQRQKRKSERPSLFGKLFKRS